MDLAGWLCLVIALACYAGACFVAYRLGFNMGVERCSELLSMLVHASDKDDADAQ